MGTKKCCVGGCSATSDTHRLFVFPKNDNLRSLWLSFLVPTNPLLIGLSKEQLLKKRVCQRHFDETQFDAVGKRISRSYPCLFSEKEIFHGVPLNTEEWSTLNEHNYFQEQDEDDSLEHDLYIGRSDDPNFHEHPLCLPAQVAHSATSCSAVEKKDDHVLDHQDLHAQATASASSSSVVENKDDRVVLEQKVLHGQVTDSAPSSSAVGNNDDRVVLEKKVLHGQVTDSAPSSSAVGNKDILPNHPVCLPTQVTDTATSAVARNKASLMKKVGSKKRQFINKIKKIAAESLGESSSQRLQKAQKVYEDPKVFEKFSTLNKQTQTFLLMQLKLARSNKMARRFSLEEKLIALSWMKESPKGYRLLEKMFALPSKRTLMRMSEKIVITTGVNPKIFEHIKMMTQNWEPKKKLCCIVFDEVALTPNLKFNEKKDIIDGFVDVAGERKLKYCDHALVFMIRGICSPWRQCIAYYFLEGTVSAAELKNILNDIVKQVSEAGLMPLALVCDQGSTFRTAIRNFKEDTTKLRSIQGLRDDGTIIVAGRDLSVFYDPPHLLKGLRNNFLTKDVLFDGKTATWKDIEFIYDIDMKLGHTRAMPKLSAHHVDPKKIKKMKVSVAAQVLSARTAAMLKYTDALYNQPNLSGMPLKSTTMKTTADLVEFIDELFDSVNGHPGGTKRGKMRKAVKKDSVHIAFWEKAIKKLQDIRFIDRSSKFAIQSGQPRILRVPSLDGWITTLKSFIRISKLLFQKYQVEYYYPRNINQDPLENFFGRVRALNYRNVNPDAHTFTYTFRTLLLSNVLSPHSKYSNCEEDCGETLLKLNYLFVDDDYNKENVSPNINKNLPTSSQYQCQEELINQVLLEKAKVHCSAYTAGYLCRKISKKINCTNCSQTYITESVSNVHNYIQHREYKALKNNNLAYPSERFLIMYRDGAQYVHDYLNAYCFKSHVGTNLKDYLTSRLALSWLGCLRHKREVSSMAIKVIIRIQAHNWCNIINKIFKGLIDEKYILKMQMPQKMALKKYKSFRLRKKCLNK